MSIANTENNINAAIVTSGSHCAPIGLGTGGASMKLSLSAKISHAQILAAARISSERTTGNDMFEAVRLAVLKRLISEELKDVIFSYLP